MITITIIVMIIALFNRFAHSAGPGKMRHKVELFGSGKDGAMRISE